MTIEEVQSRHEDHLMAQPGVTGVGITEILGLPAILVMVQTITPEIRAAIPEILDGYQVQLQETGEIHAL